ncbi:MAG: lipid-A-disaccharide synthase [Bacteroidales bacterium]|nr:lipid-A-disaccharide synthase [Bacteroidales bacterium]
MKYYIISGEASGDLHGSNLMRAIYAKDPAADIRFWGGDRMAAVGGVMAKSIKDIAFMGFVEVAAHLHEVLGNLRYCKDDITRFAPDVVVLIDYPGFNLKIAKFAHDKGYRTVYYISPQVWAWKKGRIRTMRRCIDRLCCILPFERQFYIENKFNQATYVGHPLLDEVARYKAQAREQEDAERPIIALLPGSRCQEVRKTLPLMLSVAARRTEYRYEVAGVSMLGEAFYRQLMKDATDNVSLRMDSTYDVLSSARAAVVCSGTATLEAALFKVPQVVCYRANALSVALARRLLKIKYISLVNLIADAPVVRELIQDDFNVETLEGELRMVAEEGPQRSKMLDAYEQIVELLGAQGASDRVAQECMAFCN